MKKIFHYKKIVIPLALIVLVAALWLTGLIPSGICILAANNYMQDKYPARGFRFRFIEYSSAHGKYFVHFTDKDGKFGVDYDPLDPPG